MKNLKKRLQKGETLHGCWLNLGSSVTAEIVGMSGFDWVLIDLEHGAGVEKDVLHQLQALEHTPAAAVIRVESSQRQRIHRVLDMGAEGVMVPRIGNAMEAAAVASGLHYPPDGSRGIAKMVRASGFGQNFSDYYKNAKENILGIVQIETAEVLGHLDAIAALAGIDVLFIGPSDLSMELGIFGQFDHPLFKDAVQATVNAARKAGKAAGILLQNPDDYRKYHDTGIRLIACGADGTFVSEGARNMANKLKGILAADGRSRRCGN
ncbi:aldolase/citrate lyase family protein [Flavitalea sp. BT771]|uniref:HpcH/HpaI aldolase family protein n=1 Tax=Flavitalea sp. BT771 TaxID=3063329 RepID=UPI0026E42301|nr:aldolase/citrate lyase family protein [Flavitalea sp. BT771]MDO6429457.1 aldolase/citrate lyase family protein [Flavitalea sp. BT771]MDV6218415.1 aldolase/citrate lyase family protein [Flavitalea sp. BT771]